MGRMFFNYKGFKIFQVDFPVGQDAYYFVYVLGDRYYFKSLAAARSYLAEHHPWGPPG